MNVRHGYAASILALRLALMAECIARLMRVAFIAGALLVAGAARAAARQDASGEIAVTPLWSSEQFLSSRETLEFTLSRRLDAPAERLALMVGTLDVSALLEVRATRVRYRPLALRLPSGSSEVVAYIVTEAGEWREAGRFLVNVRTRSGLDQGQIVPSADLSSNGQLDQRVPADGPDPERRTYQDITLRFGVEGSFVRDGWQLTTQGNALGVTQETERLRWNEMDVDAPAIDLSDYRVQLARGPVQLSVGNLAVGNHRYLLNEFSSRGVSGAVRVGSVAALEAGVINGTGVVGWSNLLGLARPSHRMSSLTLTLELLPDRPGGVHVDMAGFDGSLLPFSSFNQGAATDAEDSRGVGVQVALSDAAQRVRFSGGFSRSTFTNPADPFLAGDTTIVAVRTTTRSARYAEFALQVLREMTISPSLTANLAATARHERVDPLYRSVGAYVQADVENNGLELTGSLGALSVQAAISGARDNLAEIASILTTRTRSRSVSGALPLGALVRASPEDWYFPNLTASWQQVRQFGEGVPVNGDFSASHVPDQTNTNQSANLAWTRGIWNLTYTWNRSHQDNRQTGRELADFRASVHALALALMPSSRISSSLDLGIERQEHLETGTTQRLERLGGAAQFQLMRHTALTGSVSHSRGSDPFTQQRTRNTEYNGELSQGFTLYGRHDGGTQGRLFVRYARARAALRPFEPVSLIAPFITWTLTAGGSLRLY